MVSYLWYKRAFDKDFVESEHNRDKEGKFANKNEGGAKSIGEILKNLKLGESLSSRRVENGIKKIKLPEKEAAKCVEEIEKYTKDYNLGNRELIDKAINNSDSFNGKTYSGIEDKFNKEIKIGDKISGRLISWSKQENTAKTFAKNTKKILIIDKNPGLDITDMSYEPEEQEVLTSTTMEFVVKDIKKEHGFDKIYVEYIGNKEK